MSRLSKCDKDTRGKEHSSTEEKGYRNTPRRASTTKDDTERRGENNDDEADDGLSDAVMPLREVGEAVGPSDAFIRSQPAVQLRDTQVFLLEPWLNDLPGRLLPVEAHRFSCL